jgi:hypothetical protein
MLADGATQGKGGGPVRPGTGASAAGDFVPVDGKVLRLAKNGDNRDQGD